MGAGCSQRPPARDGDCVASPLRVSAGTSRHWRTGSVRRRRTRRWGLWALAREVRRRRAKGNQQGSWLEPASQTDPPWVAPQWLSWPGTTGQGQGGLASNGTAEPLATHGGEHVTDLSISPPPASWTRWGTGLGGDPSLWAAGPARCTDSHLSCPHAGSASCSVLHGPQGPSRVGGAGEDLGSSSGSVSQQWSLALQCRRA